jgi:inner membrane protein
LRATLALAALENRVVRVCRSGSAVAFFAPLDSTRYYFPVTPIRVSPMRASMLFTARGAAVMESEMLWVWMPASLVAPASGVLRARCKTRT